MLDGPAPVGRVVIARPLTEPGHSFGEAAGMIMRLGSAETEAEADGCFRRVKFRVSSWHAYRTLQTAAESKNTCATGNARRHEKMKAAVSNARADYFLQPVIFLTMCTDNGKTVEDRQNRWKNLTASLRSFDRC